MQRPVHLAFPQPPVVTSDPAPRDAGATDCSAREVPDAQLWRDAIGAARRASASAAELRSAFEAARPNKRG